jgi:hypothetical protein
VLNRGPFDGERRNAGADHHGRLCRPARAAAADAPTATSTRLHRGDLALLELSQALLANPRREGLQLLAHDDTGRAVGFAILFWTWQTLAAARVGVMNDL